MSVFLFEGAESFFNYIQMQVDTADELAKNICRAFECISDEIHLAKFEVLLYTPTSVLRKGVDGTAVVWQSDRAEASSVPCSEVFRTGDGGKAVFNQYAIKGYTWNDKELAVIHILTNQVYTAFSRLIIKELLDKALKTDVTVGVLNLNGLMQKLSDYFDRGILEQYNAVFFNIHNFKIVNKELPYSQADNVLRVYAGMLSEKLEEDESLARLGGDNFIALLHHRNAEKFINYITRVEIPYEYNGRTHNFTFGATAGVSSLKNVIDPGETMQRISIAYQAARQHKGTGIVYYSDELGREIMRQKETIAKFYPALENEEFIVYYQPKVFTKDKHICGAEALVRWRHQGQIISPADFVPVLEKDGSVCKLDFYVLERVCMLQRKCLDGGIPVVRISVNFSKRHVENPTLVRDILNVIDRYGLPREFIEIELTEGEDYRDYEVMSKLVSELKDSGISTSVDDFGTGYSSFDMLKVANVDLLKIDKSFVPLQNNEGNLKERIMFEGIVRLAKELGIQVIAEGVETKEQYEYLLGTDCDIIQGYFFDKPLPEEKYLERIQIGYC